MEDTLDLGPRIIAQVGNHFITETVFFAWIVSLALIIFAYFATRNLQRIPRGAQFWAEIIVDLVYGLVKQTMGKQNLRFAPYIGTLIMFLVVSNMLGLLGLRPVTADVNTTFACATITFVMIHYNSIRSRSLLGYLKHMGSPYPFMFPINVIGELAFPISLSFRLFGNITGGMIIMELMFHGLESLTEKLGVSLPFLTFLIPLPANFFFDMFEAVLQGFIFTMLTMAFVSNGLATHDSHSK